MNAAEFDRMCAEYLTFDLSSLGMKRDDTGWEHYAYEVTLMRGDQIHKATYRQGTGIDGLPTVGRVVACLLSDARAGFEHNDFESFASEFGYDADSRKAERIYIACRETSSAMRALLGEQYDRFELAAIESDQ